MKKTKLFISLAILTSSLLATPQARSCLKTQYEKIRRSYLKYKLRKTLGLEENYKQGLDKKTKLKRILLTTIGDIEKLFSSK